MKLGYIIVLGILLASITAGMFYIAMQKNSEIIVVTVTLAKPPDDDPDKIIQDITASLEYTTRLNVPKETPLEVPGITVIVSQNMKEISGWYSAPIPQNGSIYGNYSITVGIMGGIDRNQPINVLARVLNPAGREVAVSQYYTKV